MSHTNSEAAEAPNTTDLLATHTPQDDSQNASSTEDRAKPSAPSSLHLEQLVSSDCRTYYANHATRGTSWQRTDAEAGGDGPNDSTDLPPAWKELVDSEGRTYYAHHVSRTTKRTEGRTCGDLPARWEMLRTPQSVAYWADHNTRTVTWRDPREGGCGGSIIERVE
jgi:hypothetical protein